MNRKRQKEINKKIEQLRKNPEAEVYSEERSIWETSVLNLTNGVKEHERALKYSRAILQFCKDKLEEVKEAEKNK